MFAAVFSITRYKVSVLMFDYLCSLLYDTFRYLDYF